MHWLRSLKEHTSDKRRPEFKYLDFSQKAKQALQKSAALGSERAFKNQVRHCLRQLRSGPPHPCTISDSSRTQKQGVSTNTRTRTHKEEWGLN